MEVPKGESDLESLRRWGVHRWNLKGGLRVLSMERYLVLFDFDSKEEAERVLQRGSHQYKEQLLFLKRWGPKVGCISNMEEVKEIWVRLVGLPLHLWSKEVLKRIGDRCGGFRTVDEATTHMEHIEWARILVKKVGTDLPRLIHVETRESCFTVCLWWELAPRTSSMLSVRSSVK